MHGFLQTSFCLYKHKTMYKKQNIKKIWYTSNSLSIFRSVPLKITEGFYISHSVCNHVIKTHHNLNALIQVYAETHQIIMCYQNVLISKNLASVKQCLSALCISAKEI